METDSEIELKEKYVSLMNITEYLEHARLFGCFSIIDLRHIWLARELLSGKLNDFESEDFKKQIKIVVRALNIASHKGAFNYEQGADIYQSIKILGYSEDLL